MSKNCKYCSSELINHDPEKPLVCDRCTKGLMPNLIKFSKGNFVITHDHLDNRKANDLATVSRLQELGYTEPFKLYDDDDELYYSGRLHLDCEDEFCALDWGMADSGTTYCKIRNKKTGLYEHL
jgi:hypothetical protein